MPIYEYRCTRCGQITEEWVKSFNSPMSEPCSKCGAEAVRIVSDTSFQLKGGGWYVTEYKKSGASQSHEPASDSAPSTAKAEGAGDSAASEAPKADTTTATAKTETASAPAATESKTASAAA